MSSGESAIDQIDAMYRGEFRLPDGELMAPPWEIGETQPVVLDLLAGDRIIGRVLDAGCGTGLHAIHLADSGFEVVGFDAAPTAIQLARRRAAENRSSARFVLADAADLPPLGEFDTAIDIGLFHVLDARGQALYAAGLHRALKPGGVAFVVVFAQAVSADVLRAAFGSGWELQEPESVTLLGQLPRQALAGGWAGAELDDTGRAEIPALLATARRV